MQESHSVQGRRLSSDDLADIRHFIQVHPQWSRWRLSRVLAEKWQWYAASGQLKDMAARTLLLKLHQRKLIQLPERRRRPARRLAGPEADLFETLAPSPIRGELNCVLPLDMVLVLPKQPEHRRFQRYLAQHHYLSYSGPVGENLGYLIRARAGEDLACALFGAAAWQCAPRDRWIGWSSAQRAQRLPFIANNSRFLILPWVELNNLASHILAQLAQRISADWQRRYGHPIYLLESFVQQDRFQGACYRAANWIHAGQTTGRTRQDKLNRVIAPFKEIYLYPLTRDAQRQLCQ